MAAPLVANAALFSKKMIDNYSQSLNWGIRPILFYFGNWPVSSYSFFIFLGLTVGLVIYYFEAKKQNDLNEKSFYIIFGSLAGGILGAKILEWLINYQIFIVHISDPGVIFSGRTIVGGLIGGLVGAKITKKIIKSKERKGNLFASAAAVGVGIGRVGCFLQGCCYGKPTDLLWGVNFGDGIRRHPTQLYEVFFLLGLFVYLEVMKRRKGIKIEPGQLFVRFLILYFSFRFLIEFIRVEKLAFAGLTVFQLISIGAIIYIILSNRHILTFKKTRYGNN
jgi:phosphatidylglycerol---prolipoprotein diacylglyceryl transferase